MIPNPQGMSRDQWAQRVVQIINPFMTRVESAFFRQGRIPKVASFTVATVPSATEPGQIIYVSDETGGAVIAFSDGTNWRRVTDRAVVS